MKRILRVGEGSALTNHKCKRYTIKYLSLLAVLTSMCLYAVKQASAQQAEPAATADIKPLQIGDTIPEWLWHLPLQVVNHPEGRDTITLDDYRGKLIILDFWATWCSACISAMPEANKLFKDNHTQMITLAVSQEPFSKVAKFWQSNSITKNLGLSTITDGQILAEVFPHKTIPHLIWISSEGKVSAFTNSAQLETYEMAQALAGDFSGLKAKEVIDIHKPLYTIDAMPKEKLRHYAILFEGTLDGLGGNSVLRRAQGVTHGRLLSNKTLLTLFEICAMKLIPGYSRKNLLFISHQSEGIANDTTLYTIEVIVPTTASETLYTEVLRTLNRYSPYTAEVVPMVKTCYVLRESSVGRTEKPSKTAHGANPELTTAVSDLMWNGNIVVDETSGKRAVDSQLLSEVHDMNSLQALLDKYGIRIDHEQRQLDFLAIGENSDNQIEH